MKSYLFLVLFFYCISVYGQLAPQQSATLFEHLYTVNHEWANQTELNEKALLTTVKFKNDNERIQTHLRLVETALRKRATKQAYSQKRTNRLRNLDQLNAYSQRAVFPVNSYHSNRKPYFIDDFGTACAVGHLLQTTGFEDFANKVAKENNYAYIRELTYEELPVWADLNGFSVAELAWIQPYYGPDCTYLRLVPEISGDVYALKDVPELGGMVAGGNFTFNSTGGMVTNIGVWDAVDWIPLGSNIDGTVLTIEYFNNQLYIAGDFVLNGTNFYNIAYWDGTTWQGIQSSMMGGTVKTLKVFECNLYVGGDFQSIEGNPMPYLSAWDGTAWTATPNDCQNNPPPNALVVNNTVNVLDIFDNQLLVGGIFDQIFFNNPANALAVWDNGWDLTSPISGGTITKVNDLEQLNTAHLMPTPCLTIAGDGISFYRNGNWYYPGDSIQMAQYVLNIVTGEIRYMIKDTFYLDVAGDVQVLLSPSSPAEYGSEFGPQTRSLFYVQGDYYTDLFEYTVDYGYYSLRSSLSTTYDSPVHCIATQGPFSRVFIGGQFSTALSTDSHPSYICENYPVTNRNGMLYYEIVFTFPVEISRFETKISHNSLVSLDWTTESEYNTAQFVIERKTEKEQEFSKIGSLNAAGESFDIRNYHFENDVRDQPSGNLYYRLKIIDLDGSYEYSDIQVVQKRASESDFLLSPNPVSKGSVVLQLQALENGPATIKIYNLQGQLVLKKAHLVQYNELSTRLDTGDLETGIYLVQVQTEGEQKVGKLEIMR